MKKMIMKNVIKIEGNEEAADYSVTCSARFLSNVIIDLFEKMTDIDDSGVVAMVILREIRNIAENKYIKGGK